MSEDLSGEVIEAVLETATLWFYASGVWFIAALLFDGSQGWRVDRTVGFTQFISAGAPLYLKVAVYSMAVAIGVFVLLFGIVVIGTVAEKFCKQTSRTMAAWKAVFFGERESE